MRAANLFVGSAALGALLVCATGCDLVLGIEDLSERARDGGVSVTGGEGEKDVDATVATPDAAESDARGGDETSARACAIEADCASLDVPTTEPPGCAQFVCEARHCVLAARDDDGDGHRRKLCAAAGVTIAVGDDCDDANKLRFPGNWDGPAVPGDPSRPNRCADKIDYNCNDVPGDDVVHVDGGTKTCTCAPGDTTPCKQDESGQDVPGLTDALGGRGVCRIGARTCDANGAWGACKGAVGPKPRDCERAEDLDCDGLPDDTIDGVCECNAAHPTRACTATNNCAGTQACGTNHTWAPGCNAPSACECTAGTSRPCSGGPRNCPGGTQTCGNDRRWSACSGAPSFCECIAGDTKPCSALAGTTTPCGAFTCVGGQWNASQCRPTTVYYADDDRDTYGDPAVTQSVCTAPSGWVTRAGDCDDTTATRAPNKSEICDQSQVDENCNQQSNEGCECFVTPTRETRACNASACNASTVTCADSGRWPACPPAQGEVEYCHDDDDDGSCTASCQSACAPPWPNAKTGCAKGDCDDTNAAVNPTTPAPCTPPTGCAELALVYSASSGTCECSPTGRPAHEGVECGRYMVCGGGACRCNGGAECTPARCQTGTVQCASSASPVCAKTANLAEGTSCGASSMCSADGRCLTGCTMGQPRCSVADCAAGSQSFTCGGESICVITWLADGAACPRRPNGWVCRNHECVRP